MNPRAKRIIAGARAASGGADFETCLDRTHDAYRAMGIANVERLPVPTVPVSGLTAKVLARAGGGALFGMIRSLARRQGYDFHGSFGPNAGPDGDPGTFHGLAIAMEAKSSTMRQTSLPIVASDAPSGGGIREHQLRAIALSYRDWGRVSVLVWRNGAQADNGLPVGRGVLLPDAALRALVRYDSGGRKSIPFDEFTAFQCVPYPNHPNVEDWILPVRIWLAAGRPSPGTSGMKAYPMISYRLNEYTHTLIIESADDPMKVITVENVYPDRPTLDALARSARTPEELAEMVGRIGSANEARH